MTDEQTATAARALVVGLARTGFACVRHLAGRGYRVAVADSQDDPPRKAELHQLYPSIELRTGEFDAAWFSGFDLMVVSPGVALAHPAVAAARDAGVDVIGDVELFARMVKRPVIAVTGSNGKTTVTTLLGRILQYAGVDVEVGGNIGLPVLELRQESAPDCYALELSSFQLESTHSLEPVAATVLNLSMDHMDRYEDMAAYASAKARIFSADTAVVLNRDDRVLSTYLGDEITGRKNCISFGIGRPEGSADYGLVQFGDTTWLCRGEEQLCRTDDVALSGSHNLTNIMAALALAEAVGVEPATALPGVMDFSGLPHRMEHVASIDGVAYINDSKGTNVGATVAAIAGTHTPVVLIAGGQGKGADFAPLATALAGRARAVVLIGQDADLIAKELDKGIVQRRATSLEEAIDIAAGLAEDGDVVLFSPACASFDMFTSYEARGDAFRGLVKERAR